ncbi:beta-phosphoglucomutase [Vibrio ishigakensis]|uniref:Beta-phosphoglucomutase n=1 Tax=Vibrio ishigakensis TaxID=1481914 RepID=A0A0B8QH33_9VIBR|nr:beta-phosphoglucomutase [Vibrio ishigakensis]GAM66736.1 beta-phosphoglucomutase [Vibrio sp. JCM 19236]GAM74528.1 beta-phosphoglucomutase [Vibrio ishigakensis]
MCKAFIFDLDGVITDTAELHYQAWQRMADEEGYHFDREINEQLRGVSRQASLNIILNGAEISEEKFAELMTRKNDYYVQLLDTISAEDVLPGIEQFLLELNARGIKVALASASKNARPILHKLGLTPLFDAIGDGWSVTRSKPAPDVFIHAAGQVGVNADECIVVEDAEAGVDAAKEAGMRVIGIGPQDRVGHATWCVADTGKLNLSAVL